MSEKLDEILNFGLKMRKYKVNNCCIFIAYVCRKEQKKKKKKVSSENPKQGVSSPKSQHMPFGITSRHRKNNWQQLFKNKTQRRESRNIEETEARPGTTEAKADCMKMKKVREATHQRLFPAQHCTMQGVAPEPVVPPVKMETAETSSTWALWVVF